MKVTAEREGSSQHWVDELLLDITFIVQGGKRAEHLILLSTEM
jgi:hypothetical protein